MGGPRKRALNPTYHRFRFFGPLRAYCIASPQKKVVHMAQERRTILRWLLGGGFTASIASFVYPAIRFMNPPDTPEASVNEVSAGKVQELKPNSGKIVKFGSRPALLVRSGENDWKAFSA